MKIGLSVAALSLAVGASLWVLDTQAEEKPAPVAPAPPAAIKAVDNKGREWLLEDWKDGTAKFPAPEELAKHKEWLNDTTRPTPRT
jgi:hypothetical protein